MNLGVLCRLIILIGNVISVIMAIIILCMSINRWHEIAGSAFSILVAGYGTLVILFSLDFFNYILFVIGLILDFAFMLANAIVLVVYLNLATQYCYNYDLSKTNYIPDTLRCHDWEDHEYMVMTHQQRVVGVVVCLFIVTIVRAINSACAIFIVRQEWFSEESGSKGDVRVG